MQKYVTLSKASFNSFIQKLAKIKKVVAPASNGLKSFSFREVNSGEEIALSCIPTILPPKKYFMPQREKLVEYAKNEKKWTPVVECENLIIFGVHTCDLAGIQCLNMVFNDEPKDANYLERKNKIIIIGLECSNYCDEYASCAVVDNHFPNGGYDLFFTELETSFIIHINTEAAEKIIKNIPLFSEAKTEDIIQLEALRTKKRNIFKNEVNTTYKGLKPIFDKSTQSKVWKDLGQRCLACGNCTNVCPTCYCFDLIDEDEMDLNNGIRYRQWDSCQNEDFAKIAEGGNFRKKRGLRQRHRYLRKFNYSLNRYSRYFCVGCGRCSRGCMAKINLKETINSLIKEVKCEN